MKKKIAAVSMCRNDSFFLKRWISYYGKILGYKNLYLFIDGIDQKLPLRAKKINCFAKRFAAKEALFKALGIHNKLSFLDVEVKNNISGLPNFRIKGNSLKNLKKIFKNRKFKIHLSLSDDEPWAVASVIIFIYK